MSTFAFIFQSHNIQVAERLPKIAATVVERLQEQYDQKLEQDIKEIKGKYEYQMEQLKRDIAELQASQADREARNRATHADERAELDRVRYQVQRLQRRNDELEAENDERRREMRRDVSFKDGRAYMGNSFDFGSDMHRMEYLTNHQGSSDNSRHSSANHQNMSTAGTDNAHRANHNNNNTRYL